MVVDGQAGVTAADEEIATWLRRTHPRTPVLLAVNKCENARLADVQARHTLLLNERQAIYLGARTDCMSLNMEAAECRAPCVQ